MLTESAQALAIALIDIDQNGQTDILVGNDFAVPDQIWIQKAGNWLSAIPYTETTHSTMSFDQGDVNNDGLFDLFATDMKPYAQTPELQAAWQPILAGMADEYHLPGDIQIMENVLQIQSSQPQNIQMHRNLARNWGVDATGWSWSGKFGDLDQDGFLDLYVVNGMIEYKMFGHMPNHELVEENQVYRNNGKGKFIAENNWNLGSTLSGRGMSMGDLDQDGDLDIVVNNLRGSAQLFENQICSGSSLQISLQWPNSSNTHAIGSMAKLYSNYGAYIRDVRASSGYLSGDPSRIHFGFPNDTELYYLEVRWPDGLISQHPLLNTAKDNKAQYYIISR
jgi:hypothetical protein